MEISNVYYKKRTIVSISKRTDDVATLYNAMKDKIANDFSAKTTKS